MIRGFISIDSKDPTPLYAQLERGIRLGIATGNIEPGQQLPTVRQLAVDLRVNANTVARVYLALEREGVLTTKRGVGTFVAEGVPEKTHAPHRERRLRQAIDRFLTEATSLGYKPREIVRVLARRIREGE
ncbi:MAG TPA: GntR family transcriptional regulator [Thermoanaerobaculia bacterium]